MGIQVELLLHFTTSVIGYSFNTLLLKLCQKLWNSQPFLGWFYSFFRPFQPPNFKLLYVWLINLSSKNQLICTNSFLPMFLLVFPTFLLLFRGRAPTNTNKGMKIIGSRQWRTHSPSTTMMMMMMDQTDTTITHTFWWH